MTLFSCQPVTIGKHACNFDKDKSELQDMLSRIEYGWHVETIQKKRNSNIKVRFVGGEPTFECDYLDDLTYSENHLRASLLFMKAKVINPHNEKGRAHPIRMMSYSSSDFGNIYCFQD